MRNEKIESCQTLARQVLWDIMHSMYLNILSFCQVFVSLVTNVTKLLVTFLLTTLRENEENAVLFCCHLGGKKSSKNMVNESSLCFLIFCIFYFLTQNSIHPIFPISRFSKTCKICSFFAFSKFKILFASKSV